LSGIFLVVKLSTGIFSSFLDFESDFFRIFNFQTGKKSAMIPVLKVAYSLFYDGGCNRVGYSDRFFQLSTGFFLHFSNFELKIFRIFNFRAKKRSTKKISGLLCQVRSVVKMVAPALKYRW